jgi:hypothetical protein
MKSAQCLIAAILIITPFAKGQQSASQSESSKREGAKLTITAIGPHSREWTSVSSPTNSDGRVVPVTNGYTELATGMNVLENGKWIPASEKIEVQKDGGAKAQKSAHKAYFPGDLYDDAFDLSTPDAAHLVSRPLGLSFADGQKSVLIAQLKPGSAAHLLPSESQVLYSDICTDLRLDLLCSFKRSSYECDLVIRQQLPNPADYGFSDLSKVQLQWWTEFFNAPEPKRIPTSLEQTGDEVLDFGTMKMVQGKAFLVAGGLKPVTTEIPVKKEWVVIDGRTFLIEEIPLTSILEDLRSLPARSAAVQPNSAPENREGRLARQFALPPARPTKRTHKSVELASSDYRPGPAFVQDYLLLNSTQTNFVFQGDTTYYMSADVVLSGTNTTFEGNTVIKYASGVSLNVGTPVTWQGGAYKPVVMAGQDDDSVGEPLDVSTGFPGTNYYAARALFFDALTANTNLVLRNLRIANAQVAVGINGRNGHILSHVQFQNCGSGLALTNAEIALRNALLDHVMTNFIGSSSTGRVEHLTSDTGVWLNSGIGTNLFLTNSLLAGVTNTGSYTAQNVTTSASTAGVFLTVGGASHYLAVGSSLRDAGTTNINAGLWADLKKMTTYPPLVFSNASVAVDTTFLPQAKRDVDTPDVGFHYDPLDYAFGGSDGNANITFAAGTAVGWFRTSSGWFHAGHGLHMADTKTVTFDGRLETPDYWVRANVVQEGGNGNWDGGFGPGGISGWAWPYITNSARIVARFTRFSTLAMDWSHYRDDWGWLITSATSCDFFGGRLIGYNNQQLYTNCFFDRTYASFFTDFPDSSFSMRNCTVRGGTLNPYRFNGGTNAPVVVRESAFDGTTISTTGEGLGLTYYDYNAYLQGASQTSPGGAHDQMVTNFNWRTGWLGNYYLPTNSTLINTGGVTADLIYLYHFTSQTNQIKETNSVVDIGYHYLAVTGTGAPVDTDGDAVPDYWEDLNGNGNGADDPTSWQTYNSTNALSGNAALTVFTLLK